MSIASELTNLEGNIEDSYDAVNDMGGIIPAQRNMDNLDQAIRTIPQNTGTTYTAGYGIDIDANNEISIDDTVVAELTDIPGVMIGATSSAPGVGGTVPAPAAGDEAKVLSGAGTWVNQPTIPTVPTKTSDLTNDGDDGVHAFLATDDVATVATSGLYSDLTGTPTIPTNTSDLVNDGSDGTSTYVEADDLATVATSGSYNDLLNKPTIPTVNNATLTIQKNGSDVASFTANASSNVTANITVPTSFSGLSGTVSTSQIADKAVTVAKLADLTYGTGTLNTTYFSSGRVQWVKHGRMITVTMSDLALKAKPPDSTNATNAISGLPTSASWKQNDVVNLTRYGGTTVPLSLRMDGNKTALTFHYTSGTANGTYNGQFTYPAA